jgi:hypothetical protein
VISVEVKVKLYIILKKYGEGKADGTLIVPGASAPSGRQKAVSQTIPPVCRLLTSPISGTGG